jgi:hypothetical protein
MEPVAKSLPDVKDARAGPMIQPSEDRRERPITLIQQNDVVHESADANRVQRFGSGKSQSADSLPKNLQDMVYREDRGTVVGLQIPWFIRKSNAVER